MRGKIDEGAAILSVSFFVVRCRNGGKYMCNVGQFAGQES